MSANSASAGRKFFGGLIGAAVLITVLAFVLQAAHIIH